MATRVPKGMAAEEPSPHRIRFITKKSANTTLSKTCKRRKVDWMAEWLCGVDLDTERNAAGWEQQKQPHPGQRNDVSKTLVFHFSPPKADQGKTQEWVSRKNLKKWSNDNIWFPIKLTYSINTRVLLTFVETSSDVSSWSSQENPENHGAGHQSPTIGWREEPQAGENYQRHSLSITTRRMEDSSIIELITRSL